MFRRAKGSRREGGKVQTKRQTEREREEREGKWRRNESTSFTRKYVPFRSRENKVNVVKDTQFVRDKKEEEEEEEREEESRGGLRKEGGRGA